ncbi:MAG: glycosyltransferase family protein [Burkholderiaceae bacterium]|nr:glycosyltransferase family protein [Burkholderiaceae bacterium]
MRALNRLLEQGQLDEAETIAIRLTQERPQHGPAWKFLGVILKLQGRHGEALRAMHRAFQLLPDDDQVQSNLGAALAEAGELPAAEQLHRRALDINPRNTQTHTNLGNVLSLQGRMEEAETCLRRALELQPDFAQGHHNLGSLLHDLGRIAEARSCYRRAIELDRNLAQTHWNDSMCQLQAGDFDQGWQQYEWRLQTAHIRVRRFEQAQWSGQDLQDKTVLLHAEQGLGDTLQFCRYAPLVAARGARVLLQAPSALKRLLTGLPGVAQLMAEGEVLPAFDYHCPMLSLPLAFGTCLSSIPARVPYLTVTSNAADAWRKNLEAMDIPRIGIAWAGNPQHRHDRWRSIALEHFLDLADGNQTFHCLQKDISVTDLSLLETRADVYRHALNDFSDTAALIMALDLVITVDTAVAHLAGALGKPVWLLLPFQADWRWLTQREDSPWYPTMRLFRQTVREDWGSVFAAVRQALARRFGKT